jgi:hypothetical protein
MPERTLERTECDSMLEMWGDIMSKAYIRRRKLKEIERMAEEHADWFVEITSPMLKEVAKTFFIHGYEHRRKEENVQK